LFEKSGKTPKLQLGRFAQKSPTIRRGRLNAGGGRKSLDNSIAKNLPKKPGKLPEGKKKISAVRGISKEERGVKIVGRAVGLLSPAILGGERWRNWGNGS